MTRIVALRPTNRHLTIIPHFIRREKSSDVLLPDDFKQEEATYVKATVIDVASDCCDDFRRLNFSGENSDVIVQRSMIEEVTVDNKTHYMILENYVMGIYRRPLLHED